jgi:Tfp pilus assembly protein FimT
MLRVRASSSADTLITSINYARSEAITRNQRIDFCASDDGVNCSAPQNWNSGWIVMIQASNEVLRYKNISSPGASIILADASDAEISPIKVVFFSSGETRLEFVAGTPVEQEFKFFTQVDGCDNPQLNIRREVSIAISGLMTVDSRQQCL